MRVARAMFIGAAVLAVACATAPPEPPRAGDGGAQRGRGAGPQRGGAAQGRGRGASITAPRVERRTYLFAPTNERLEYAIYVSPAVDLDKANALVIVLHGLNANPVSWLPRVIGAVPNANYIMVAPMGYNPQGWYGANGANGIGAGRASGSPANLGELSELDVMNVLDLMRKEFRIDPNRIYIFGNSMGGAGAIHLGIKHREIWAAVGARAPAIRSWHHTPDELEPARHLPMILVHGDADRLVPVEQSRQWAAKMKELNMTFEYHELRGIGHGVDPDGVRAVFRFFDAHSKPAIR